MYVNDVFYGQYTADLMQRDWYPSSGVYPSDTSMGLIFIAKDGGTIAADSAVFAIGESVHYVNGNWLRFGGGGSGTGPSTTSYIVGPASAGGNYASVDLAVSAITTAGANKATIYILPGDYVSSGGFTLPANINLVAHGGTVKLDTCIINLTSSTDVDMNFTGLYFTNSVFIRYGSSVPASEISLTFNDCVFKKSMHCSLVNSSVVVNITDSTVEQIGGEQIPSNGHVRYNCNNVIFSNSGAGNSFNIYKNSLFFGCKFINFITECLVNNINPTFSTGSTFRDCHFDVGNNDVIGFNNGGPLNYLIDCTFNHTGIGRIVLVDGLSTVHYTDIRSFNGSTNIFNVISGTVSQIPNIMTISPSQIVASGTLDNTTFLRGDGNWTSVLPSDSSGMLKNDGYGGLSWANYQLTRHSTDLLGSAGQSAFMHAYPIDASVTVFVNGFRIQPSQYVVSSPYIILNVPVSYNNTEVSIETVEIGLI